MDIGILIPTFVAALAASLAITWFKNKITNFNPVGASSKSGTIKPHRGMIYFVLSGGVIIFTSGILATTYIDGMLVYGPACVLLGIFFVVFSIPSLTPIHDINWTNDSLNGPSSVAFKIMGISRKEMKWSEIARTGLIKGGYYYVENNDKDRIYWSRCYSQFQNFESTLRKNCPNLHLPKYEIL